MKKDQKYINELLSQYRDGSISAKDRHELERIALDDPFVFDSMEGYALHGDKQSDEILAQVKSQTRTTKGRIINMRSISIAAGIAMLIGGLFWVDGQLNQADLENFSQLEESTIVEESVIDDQDLYVADEVNETEMEDKPINEGNDPQPKSLEGREPQMAKAKERMPEVSINTEIAESENNTKVIATDRPESVTAAPKVIEQETEMSTTNVTSAPEPDMANTSVEAESLPPMAQPSARSRMADNTSIKKKKESITKSEDPFSDPPAGEDLFDSESNVVMSIQRILSTPRRMVSGVIRDNTGEPLIGANVFVPNSEIGVTTDFDGSFSFEIDSTINQLEIGYIGYADLVMSLDTTSAYDIVLDEDYASLDEVVVTGYASNVSEPQPSYVLPPEGRSAFKKVVKAKAVYGCNQSGKVRLKFTVTKYGEVIDFEVKKSLSPLCDQRAIDIIKSSGTWDNQFNKDKKVRYTVSF